MVWRPGPFPAAVAAALMLIAFLLASNSLTGQAIGETTPVVESDAVFPDFSLRPLYEGAEPLDSNYFADHDVTIVNFFASWCLPCRIEHPHLVELQRLGVPVVGINYMDEAKAAVQYLESTGDPYDRIGIDEGDRFDATLMVYDIPQTFIVDRQGVILFRQVGRLQPQVLRETVYPLVMANAPAEIFTSGSFTMSGMIIALIVLIASALLLIIILRGGKAREEGGKLKALSIAGIILPALYIVVIQTSGPGSAPPVDIEETYAALNELIEAEQDRPAVPVPGDMSMEGVTARLAQRLESDPGDIAGWVLLARSYVSTGQIDKATEAFEAAITHSPDNVDLKISYGETLVNIAGGQVSPRARKIFADAVAAQPEHPAAQYYLALAEYQNEDRQAAYDRWLRLARTSPADAPWLGAVQQQLDRTAAELGLEAEQFAIAAVVPEPSPPAHNEVAGPMDGASGVDQESIRSMVEGLSVRLETDPDDLDGWLMLGRSYGVLEDWDSAVEAYERALALAPSDAGISELLDSAKDAANR